VGWVASRMTWDQSGEACWRQRWLIRTLLVRLVTLTWTRLARWPQLLPIDPQTPAASPPPSPCPCLSPHSSLAQETPPTVRPCPTSILMQQCRRQVARILVPWREVREGQASYRLRLVACAGSIVSCHPPSHSAGGPRAVVSPARQELVSVEKDCRVGWFAARLRTRTVGRAVVEAQATAFQGTGGGHRTPWWSLKLRSARRCTRRLGRDEAPCSLSSTQSSRRRSHRRTAQHQPQTVETSASESLPSSHSSPSSS
jgi:hypothetical protein